ncbi:MAG: GAF domain-containing protein [Deltaproteobacteria bacterium]|nr:GAF domain-containing protein [Deltaproteobacteria bacterium]
MMLSKIAETNLNSNPFEDQLSVWLLFIGFSSGIAQALFPFTDIPQFNNRLSAFFSLLCHAGPLVVFLRRHLSANATYGKSGDQLVRYVRITLPILFAVLMASPYFVACFGPIFTLCAIITLGIGITTRDPLYFCYGLAYLVTGLKVLGLPYLPHSQVTTFFVGTAISYDLTIRFRLGAKLTRLAKRARRHGTQSSGADFSATLVKEAFRQIGAGRLTVLTLQRGGGCRLEIITSANETVPSEIFHRDSLPPLFAHAISSQRTLWHLKEDDPLLRNIRRGQKPSGSYKGEILSVVPILGETHPVGAIAFTDYPTQWANDPQKNSELQAIVNLLQPLLIESMTSEALVHRSELVESISEIQTSISKLSSSFETNPSDTRQSEHHYQTIIEKIAEKLDAFGYIAKLDPNTRQFEILGITGYPKEVHDRLTMGRLFALRENEQGPLALAVNREQPVIVTDVQLWKQVLHENTNTFFQKSGTKSCAAIPIYKTIRDQVGAVIEKAIWGVIFLERRSEAPFTLQYSRALSLLANSIDEFIEHIDQKQALERTKKVLSAFVPQRILDRVINENIELEKDQGFLVMLDLKNSTKISLEVGSETWTRNVQILIPSIEKICHKYRLQLQLAIWDAFYLTLSTPTPSAQDVIEILAFVNEIVPVIDDWYTTHYEKLSFTETSSEQKARFCLTYGDISRGFSVGTTRNWTIVGNEMASISKFEDVCKKLSGVIFADDSLVEQINTSYWKNTGSCTPSTSRKIYVLPGSWSDYLHLKKAS